MATASLPKSGAVSRGYNFASTWEQSSPLTEQQHGAIAALSNAVAERPFPPNLSQDQILGKDSHINASVPSDASVDESASIDAVLINTHQFYKWFTDLESAMKSETEEKYNLYVNTLVGRIQICDGILNQVDDTLNLFDELQMLHQTVATKTKTLHDACDRLLLEKQRLIDFAEALRSKLNYFDELENASTNFYSTNMNIRNEQFLPLLKRLDDCISYVEGNPQYAESGVYLVKFRQLQSRALGMMRSHVLSVLKVASFQVQAAIRDSGSSKTSFSEGVEASVIYVRFKAAASELKPILEEIESRSSRKEYVQILLECHRLYCEQRLSLIKSIVQHRITEFSRKEALSSLTRSGCAYLMQVCQLEHQLFDHFFPSSSKEVSTLAPLIDPLCTYLYDTLRPKLIHEANLDALCELADILKVEVLGEQLGRHSESLAGLRPTLQRILADIHERLTFCARTHIRDTENNQKHVLIRQIQKSWKTISKFFLFKEGIRRSEESRGVREAVVDGEEVRVLSSYTSDDDEDGDDDGDGDGGVDHNNGGNNGTNGETYSLEGHMQGLRLTSDHNMVCDMVMATDHNLRDLRALIANYRPSEEDLDYPARLETSIETTSNNTVDDNSHIFKSWYPPMERTVSCLSKLYHCLEPAVFTGLAQEAVEFCSVSIQNASKLVAKRSSTMDGQLFLVKHLLILREQIAPFDIEFSVTHKELDFSHLLEHLRRILRGQASLFDWSRSASLARSFSPRVLESQIDARKELEKSFKVACEEFIMSVTKLVVDPMLSFVTKVTAVKHALSSGMQDQKVNSVLAKPLKDQAFVTPEKVAELIQKVSIAIQEDLPKVMTKMKLYLQNPSTRMILFKAIKTNIVEAHAQLQSLIKSEYSQEEIWSIGMVPIQDLQAQLDSLL